MPSIRAVLKKLERRKLITKEDFNEVFDNLENHDKEVRNKALEEFEPITGYYYKGQQLYVRKGAKDGEINKEG